MGKLKPKSIKGKKKEEAFFHMCDGQRKSSALSIYRKNKMGKGAKITYHNNEWVHIWCGTAYLIIL